MEKNHFVSVAAIVVNDNDEVLLIKSPWRGWEFPGGVVESGESLQEALIREVFEETGVHIQITGFIGICKNTERDIINIDFACKYVNGTLTVSDESDQVSWFSKEDALGIVENELTKKRLANMLSNDTVIHCFAFTKEPFAIGIDEAYKVGI